MRAQKLHCSTVPGEKPSPHKEFSYCGKRKKADLSTDKTHQIFCNTFFNMAFTLTFLLETNLQGRNPNVRSSPGLLLKERNFDSSHVEDTPRNQSIFQCEDHSSIVIIIHSPSATIVNMLMCVPGLPCVNTLRVSQMHESETGGSKRAEGNAI